jgi:hypothetical protein
MAIAWPCPPALAQAPDPGTVTILEGQALIHRGSGRLHAAKGVRLAGGDIVETGTDTFAQIEAPDGTLLQLGPSTRLLAQATMARGKTERWPHLMGGWVKLASSRRDAAAGPGFELRAPSFEIQPNAAVLVQQNTPSELLLLVEAGEARLAERGQGAAAELKQFLPAQAAGAWRRQRQRARHVRGRDAARVPRFAAAADGALPGSARAAARGRALRLCRCRGLAQGGALGAAPADAPLARPGLPGRASGQLVGAPRVGHDRPSASTP